MNTRLSMRQRLLLGTIIGGSLLAVAGGASAQTTTQQDQATDIGEVVVTGSRIRRDPTTAPTPLIQVQQEQLLETGMPTMIDYLATIPALSNSIVPSDTTGGLNGAGVSAANLRSLGTSRVLTLIDGRRQVGHQVGQLLVDVDSIPRLLIQNIEIITGGASSVYGADAVAGVLNYVLRKDFEGLEIDANVGQLAGSDADAPLTKRVSVLAGANLLDDRLNVYAFGEWEQIDEIRRDDVAWLRDGRTFITATPFFDDDPTSAAVGPVSDGVYDNDVAYGLRRVDRPRWGQTTIANSQRPSALTDPDVPLTACTSVTSANCYAVDPTKTYWYEGGQARLINFGERVGSAGNNRVYGRGGDGDNANTSFGGFSLTPRNESQRYQLGANFRVNDNVTAYAEAKFIEEDSVLQSQSSFFDVIITDSLAGVNEVQRVVNSSTFSTRLDNAYLPAMIRTAMISNMVSTWTANQNAPGTETGTTNRQWARHSAFGIDRTQENQRRLSRYVAALRGDYDRLGFIDNFSWDLSYVRGEMNNLNLEHGMDIIRTAHAQDAVVDTAGLVNGKPGEIVCRVRLLAAQGLPLTNYNELTNKPAFGGSLTISPNDPTVRDCKPLNVFGAGNQSQEALDFISATIFVDEKNIQDDFVGSVSGQLWDPWGAGPIGFSLGYEYRREMAEGLGRSNSTRNRYLQLNTGADFPTTEYDSNEIFGELSLPLFRDTWMGEYAELSGSYRSFDYSNAGKGDVYGINLVYRPIPDITFKSSYNTSFRTPLMSETNAPFTQTFANGFIDPCDTRQINSASRVGNERINRIANCTILATREGVTYDFAQATTDTADDYRPTYASGIAGVNGGNSALTPETSSSFTISAVVQPRFMPNATLVLDYYEIKIDDIIQSLTAAQLAAQCVDGAQLDEFACSRIFRNNPVTGESFDNFKVGAANGDPLGGFIQVPVNFAAREVRGLDFDFRYRFDTEEMAGRNWGVFNYSVSGSWLIDQKNFNNRSAPGAFVQQDTTQYFPRVRLTSRLTWVPTDALSVSWIADFQTAQDWTNATSLAGLNIRDLVASGNLDARPLASLSTGSFVRHDLTMRYHVNEELTVRAGVTNVLNEEQSQWLGSAISSNFDSYGRRFNIGLNWRPY
ncbi:TonB-dependent receptor [Brevundimonas kwangchunensis]|uniref:TonB-dependent receptor n=1 Tax=Brevundimonas kwangchunensis TaxID=322163 RepID=A0ABN1H3V4_9CAUL